MKSKDRDRTIVAILIIVAIALAVYIYVQPQTAIEVLAYDKSGALLSITSPSATHIQFVVNAHSTSDATTDIKLTNIVGYQPFTDSFIGAGTQTVQAGGDATWNSNLVEIDGLELGVHVIELTVRQELIYAGELRFEEVTLNKSLYVYECLEGKCIREGLICECTSCGDCTSKIADYDCAETRLTTDITEYPLQCVNIQTDSKVFDCQGHTIDGDDAHPALAGVNVFGEYNLVRNCVITDFDPGIRMGLGSNNNIIRGNTIDPDGLAGIYCKRCSNNRIEQNTITNDDMDIGVNAGVLLWLSSDNVLHTNRICIPQFDIRNESSSGNVGYENTCNDAFGVWNDVGATGCTYSC